MQIYERVCHDIKPKNSCYFCLYIKQTTEYSLSDETECVRICHIEERQTLSKELLVLVLSGYLRHLDARDIKKIVPLAGAL